MSHFQHRADVRRIKYGEFDTETAIEILRAAKAEVDAAANTSWEYAGEVRDAERVLIYGTCECDDD